MGAMSSITAQRYAKVGAVLFLLSITGGYFGELYLPSQLMVRGDAAATAQNIMANPFLHRLGFATYLVEAVCDIGLMWIFYVLLRPVNREMALLSAFFGVVATATFASAELFYLAPTLILGDGAYLGSFTREQRDTLAMLSIRLYGLGAGVLMVFYGTAWAIRGYLIFRSGYLPRFIGVLFMIAGAGFVIRNFLLLLLPRAASDVFLAPMFLAAISVTLWLLFKGIDGAQWDKRQGLPEKLETK